MSRKQNKQRNKQNVKKQSEKETRQALQYMDKHLLEHKFPYECEKLPLELLNEEEQELVNKCINHEKFKDREEFLKLSKLLKEYRAEINNDDTDEIKENIDRTIELIESEQEFLDLLDSEQYNELKVRLPMPNGREVEFNFEILPIEDSKVVTSLQMQLDLFRDFSDKEKQVYIKQQKGSKLSKYEQVVMDKINDHIAEVTSQENDRIMNTLLASQLRLADSSTDYDKRVEFWSKFPFNPKVAVFMKVQERLGLTDVANERLFPSC